MEYPVGSLPGFGINLDFTDDQIIISSDVENGAFAAVLFNGFDITFAPGLLTSAVADGSSQFNPISIVVSGDHLFLNYSGVTGLSLTDHSIINLNSGGSGEAPEPASLALVSVGIVSLGFLRRRRL